MTTTPKFQKTLHDTTFVEGGEMATLMRSHDFRAGTIASLFQVDLRQETEGWNLTQVYQSRAAEVVTHLTERSRVFSWRSLVKISQRCFRDAHCQSRTPP